MSGLQHPDEIILPADLFSPQTIAILGASGEPDKLAHRPLQYLRRLGYGGAVYPVNPRRAEILGWRCYRNLDEISGPIDAALISLPAPLVPAALHACAERGVRLAVVLSSGVELSTLARSDLLVMGPNSMGFLNARDRVAASWSSSLDLPAIRPGRVALIAQSGGLGGSILNRLQDRGVGISYAFWSGNEAQLDACHLVRFLLDDPETSVVALLIEGLRRPRRFLELAALALERRKPIVALKLARTPAAANLAIAHTGILAGASRGYRAAFRQYGVVEVQSLDELVDTAALFARVPLPDGDGLGVITSSGGATVLVTDLCQDLGLRLPDFAPETKADLAAMLPPYAPEPTNPLDITAGLSEEALFAPLERMARDPSIDVVLNVVTMIGGAGRLRDRAEGLIAARARVAKPVVSCWTAGSLARAGLELLAEADLPFYTAPEACLRGIKALFDYRRRATRPGPPRRPAELAAAAERVRAELLALRASGARVLDERASAPLLAAYGLPMVRSVPAATAAEAVAAAEQLGYPVVLKVDVKGLAHKSRLGGVRLGLRDAAEVAAAFAAIEAAVRAAAPEAAFRGVLVQPEAPPGFEAVIGFAADPQFGPLVLLGSGGAYAEALAQVAARLAPLTAADAEEMIAESPLRAIPGREQLVEALTRLAWFADDHRDLVAECDINPLRIAAGTLLGVDALIVLHDV